MAQESQRLKRGPAAAYLESSGTASFDARADYDINGIVSSLDFSLLAANYLKYSPIAVP